MLRSHHLRALADILLFGHLPFHFDNVYYEQLCRSTLSSSQGTIRIDIVMLPTYHRRYTFFFFSTAGFLFIHSYHDKL